MAYLADILLLGVSMHFLAILTLAFYLLGMFQAVIDEDSTVRFPLAAMVVLLPIALSIAVLASW